MKVFIILLLKFFLLKLTISSHFRGGYFYAEPYQNINDTIYMTVTVHLSWRRSYDNFTYCDQYLILNHTGISPLNQTFICT